MREEFGLEVLNCLDRINRKLDVLIELNDDFRRTSDRIVSLGRQDEGPL